VMKAVETASYIAIDLELSGIGASRDLGHPNVEERYSSIRHVADTRAILSLGLSCVRFLTSHPTSAAPGENEEHKNYNWTFLVQTYDILCACQDEYTIDPRSVKFLVDHGFDFNRQMAFGLPYRRGRPMVAEKGTVEVRPQNSSVDLIDSSSVFTHSLVDLVPRSHVLRTLRRYVLTSNAPVLFFVGERHHSRNPSPENSHDLPQRSSRRRVPLPSLPLASPARDAPQVHG
jgi:target of EGR1 protein 1